jgi:transcriptional regulator with XRE-family HTH domain
MTPTHQESGTVGERIRHFRRIAGLTQEELSEKAKLSVRAIRDLELDKVRRPRRHTLRLLALALGLDNVDTDRFVAAARMIESPRTVATAETGTAGRPPEWIGLQPVLGQLIGQFSPERVLVVPVFMACRTCSGCIRSVKTIEEDANAWIAAWERRPETPGT